MGRKGVHRSRRPRRLARRTDGTRQQLATKTNRIVAGGINYDGRFYNPDMIRFCRRIKRDLVRWACRKYKRLRRHKTRAIRFIADVARRQPGLFAHWRWGVRPAGWTMGAR